MEKIIISENAEVARQHIEQLKKFAININDLIRNYNELPALDKITTSVQIRSFLNNPQKYLDHAILTETGLSYGKKQPEPAKVAELYGIPYNEFLRLCEKTNTSLEFLRIDEKKLSVEFDKSKEPEIYESFREYARPEETEEVEKCRAMCKLMNECFYRYRIPPDDMNNVSAFARFIKCELGSNGHTWEFKENISFIREKLYYESIHGKQNE